MPTAEAVLSWATSVANEWRWLAIAWHVALGALLVAVSRFRISERLVARLLVLPIVSVAALAWLSRNPFNGLMFTIAAGLLLRSVRHLPRSGTTRAARGWQFAGGMLIAFGWLYPHFLITDTWPAYAYASPFGLLPCPTLSVVVGVTLAAGGFRSVGWNAVVAAAGVLYGAIGVFRLGVVLDVWLLVGATLLGILTVIELLSRVRAERRGHVKVTAMSHKKRLRVAIYGAVLATAFTSGPGGAAGRTVMATSTFEIPESVRTEHRAIHAALEDAQNAPGRVGAAARRLAQVLHPHFVREEEIALPPLGLLASLAGGSLPADARDILPLTDALARELPRMLEEHVRIRAAVGELRSAAEAEHAPAHVALADQLALHARSEEEVLYPAAVLVGDVVRARLRRNGEIR